MNQTTSPPKSIRTNASIAADNSIFSGQQVLINVNPSDEQRSNATVLLARLHQFLEAGLEVRVARPARQKERVILSFQDKERKLSFDAVADDPKTRCDRHNSWLVTYRLRPQIPLYLRKHLCDDDVEAHRLDRWLDEANGIPVGWRQADETVAMQILTHGNDGLCVLSSVSPEVTEQFRISFSRPRKTTVMTKVEWRMRLGERWLIGCSFLLDDDRKRFRTIRDELQEVDLITDEFHRSLVLGS